MAERITLRMLGTGAVGSLIGGLLSLGGHEVLFSGADDEMPGVTRTGLRLLLPTGWKIHPPLRPWDGEPVDLVLVALKRTFLRRLGRHRSGGQSAGTGFRERMGVRPGEKLVFLNCGEEDLRPLELDGEKPGLCLTLLEAVRLQPSEVELHSARPVLLLQKDPRLSGILRTLKPFGFQVLETDDIGPATHAFFLRQLLELPAALCGIPLAYLLSFSEGREIARKVLEEGAAVLTRSRRRPGKLPVMDPGELLKSLGDPKAQVRFAAARHLPNRTYGSVLQSIFRNRALEVRELNERLVQMGSAAGVDTRWNWHLLQRTERVLRVGFYPDPAHLLEAVR